MGLVGISECVAVMQDEMAFLHEESILARSSAAPGI